MSEIRVIIIDQSKEIYEKLNDALKSERRIKIIGYSTGRDEGFKKIKQFQPDVALIDIFFLKESDWQSELIQSIPVILLARPLVDEVAKTLTAISLGAVDFINKSDLKESNFQKELTFKIKNAYKRRKITITENNRKRVKKTYTTLKNDIQLSKKNTVVAIGTSTGGPKALQKILEQLPKDFSAPIFIVQHMPSGFTRSLAKRLDRQTNLTVKEGVDGEIARPGTVYIAPGDYHMIVKQEGNELTVHLHQEELKRGHRPSVDILFNSIAKLKDVNMIAIVLTGMGKDGAEGVRTIKSRNKSAVIIAESEQSAVIFGMPQAALETNCVTDIVHIDEIGKKIKSYIER